MENKNIHDCIKANIAALTKEHSERFPQIPLYDKTMPSTDHLRRVIDEIKNIVFPSYFGPSVNVHSLKYHTEVSLERLYKLLQEQIYRALSFDFIEEETHSCDTQKRASILCIHFIDKLSQIKYMLSTDVKAIFEGDPAAKNYAEIIFCYPAIKAILNYRVASELFLLKIPLIPRIISEMAHADTGIDIHPGAKIGSHFSIDHGTGVVVGQTAIIGKHVRLYQGVTLGAKSFSFDTDGKAIDKPRHPILEDHVTIYSNASILGRITIGAGSIVGGNLWLTNSVPANSRVLQTKAIESAFSDGSGI